MISEALDQIERKKGWKVPKAPTSATESPRKGEEAAKKRHKRQSECEGQRYQDVLPALEEAKTLFAHWLPEYCADCSAFDRVPCIAFSGLYVRYAGPKKKTVDWHLLVHLETLAEQAVAKRVVEWLKGRGVASYVKEGTMD